MRLVVVLDCDDADALADFWRVVLGYEGEPFEFPYLRLSDPTGRWPDLLLQQVPEPKAGKNRMHLDLQVHDVEGEAERLVAAGARIVQPAHDDDGFLTVVLQDPQGNEFCVLRPPDGDWRLSEI
jgi:predicted enzyme related to lactoylglutathione lyase